MAVGCHFYGSFKGNEVDQELSATKLANHHNSLTRPHSNARPEREEPPDTPAVDKGKQAPIGTTRT